MNIDAPSESKVYIPAGGGSAGLQDSNKWWRRRYNHKTREADLWLELNLETVEHSEVYWTHGIMGRKLFATGVPIIP